jgi:hypothetical protein
VEKFLWAGVIVPCREMPAREVEVWHDRASGRVSPVGSAQQARCGAAGNGPNYLRPPLSVLSVSWKLGREGAPPICCVTCPEPESTGRCFGARVVVRCFRVI